MIKFPLKHAAVMAALAVASAGANAQTVTDLGEVSTSAPTTFTGTVLGSEQSFMDIFTFTLQEPNISSGYNVVNLPVNIPDVGSLGTIFSSMALISYGADGVRGTADDQVLRSIDSTSPGFDQDNLSFSWDGPLTGGHYLTVGGVTSGSLGGAYSGSIAAAVPEPETYAMLLAGLGLMASVVRRRSQRKVPE